MPYSVHKMMDCADS